MGMDVFGENPISPEGEYFRRNVWGWRPLANFIIEVRPEIARQCESWHTNDGAGLDAEWSIKLADELDKMIANGEAEAYVEIREATNANLPNEVCDLCNGSGIRDFAQVPSMDKTEGTGECNKCNGQGSVRPFETWYPLSLSDIREFAQFVRASGGFRIC